MGVTKVALSNSNDLGYARPTTHMRSRGIIFRNFLGSHHINPENCCSPPCAQQCHGESPDW